MEIDTITYKKREKRTTKICEKNGVSYIQFPILESEHLIHGFSTRLGGVSKGYFSSMNLSFTRGDEKEAVLENYKRMGQALGFDEKKCVLSDQIHETKIHIVTKEDAGKGIVKPRMEGIDGLLTKEKGIPLVTFYADCVPMYFYDPINQAGGMAHGGWRGTVAWIGKKMVECMKENFGSKPKDIICVIGPSICQDCYEVSEDVASEFKAAFTQKEYESMIIEKGNGKYQLDLWRANEIVLTNAGITKEHLAVTDLCTCCNPKFLFSHRASHGKRGNLAAFFCLK